MKVSCLNQGNFDLDFCWPTAPSWAEMGSWAVGRVWGPWGGLGRDSGAVGALRGPALGNSRFFALSSFISAKSHFKRCAGHPPTSELTRCCKDWSLPPVLTNNCEKKGNLLVGYCLVRLSPHPQVPRVCITQTWQGYIFSESPWCVHSCFAKRVGCLLHNRN